MTSRYSTSYTCSIKKTGYVLTLKKEMNKMDQNPPITVHGRVTYMYMVQYEPVQVHFCFPETSANYKMIDASKKCSR